VQFQGDSQEEVDIQRVVMGDKRPGGGPPAIVWSVGPSTSTKPRPQACYGSIARSSTAAKRFEHAVGMN